jgi:prepilin-type N-terminal cleavage/methylation domain-containing protein/prepilin-type processing-associated H-X9-DG protein
VRPPGQAGFRPTGCKGFTLLELLMTMGIIAMLVSIMLPAMSACRQAGRNLKCLSQMRRGAYEFRMFADDFAFRSRGDSAAFGESRFKIEDFQDSLYRVDEYWDLPRDKPVTYDSSTEMMICPAGPAFLQRFPEQGQSHDPGFVGPHANVSIAVNMRLYRCAQVIWGAGYLVPATVTGRILDHPNVPILLDVDGAKAKSRKQLPYYIAPPVNPRDPYGSGRYWFPAFRHQGSINVAFVGGHVLSSRQPLNERGWDWSYQPSD